MFFRLGFINITRQLGRSLLALISLVIAAVSLTNTLSISLGYPANAFADYRQYLGGDIVVYPTSIMGNPTQTTQLDLYRLPEDAFSTLTTLYPHLTEAGFLASEAPVLRPFSESDQAKLLAHKQVTAVNPLYRMPAWRQDSNFDLSQASLRPLEPGSGLWQHIMDSRQPELDPAATIPIWINSRQDHNTLLPEVGTSIDIQIPRILLAPDGSLQYDTAQMASQQVIVAGHYELATRTISWPNTDPTGDDFLSEQGYFNHDEIWMHPTHWAQLWQMATGGLEPMAASLGLQVKDLSILESTVGELQVSFPQWTTVSSPNLVKKSESTALLDSFQRAPSEYWSDRPSKAQLAFPLDVNRALSAFIYLNAGLLMAARMLTGAAARKKEIGVLKALGGRHRDILFMALTEAVILCLIGSTLGFMLAYPAALFQQISNQLPWAQIFNLLAKNYGIILGQTLVIAIIFGILPAWRLSKLTVNEVLRA